MLGPGNYDDVCTFVRKHTRSKVVCLLVRGGARGDGFGCQVSTRDVRHTREQLEEIIADLRHVANTLEADAGRLIELSEDEVIRECGGNSDV